MKCGWFLVEILAKFGWQGCDTISKFISTLNLKNEVSMKIIIDYTNEIDFKIEYVHTISLEMLNLVPGLRIIIFII